VTDGPAFSPAPVTLENEFVRLEPLDRAHAAALYEHGRDDSLWEMTTRPAFTSVTDTEAWIDETRAEMQAGRQVAFAIIDRSTGTAVGSTRYFDFRPNDRALEIGYTWLGRTAQGTAINPAAKLTLLEHAFETLGAIRVQFKTDLRNEQSQRALEKMGATREGVLRKHMRLWTGHIRDSAYYSVIDDEWPATAA